MIRLLPLMALLSAACDDGLAPPFLSGDLAVSLDQGVDFATMLDGPASPGPDLRTVDGPPLRSCATACDCIPGERCQNGTCAMGTVLVFCCGTATCSGSNLCQFANGSFSQCSGPGDGGVVVPDAGSATSCMMRACTPGAVGDALCKLDCGRANATCGGGGIPHCIP